MDVVDDAGRGLASQARLVGQVVAGELFYRGAVEWGFTGWSVTDLLVRSKPLVRETSPFETVKRGGRVARAESPGRDPLR